MENISVAYLLIDISVTSLLLDVQIRDLHLTSAQFA